MSYMSTQYYHSLIALGSMQTDVMKINLSLLGKRIVDSVMQCHGESALLNF